MVLKIINIMILMCTISCSQASEQLFAYSNGVAHFYDGIKIIPDDYLRGRKDVIKVELPNSLEEVGCCAFEKTGIECIEFPEGVNKLGQWCLSDCPHLSKVIVPLTIVRFLDNFPKDVVSSADAYEEERLIRESIGIDHVDYVAKIDRTNNIVTFDIIKKPKTQGNAAHDIDTHEPRQTDNYLKPQKARKPNKRCIEYYFPKKPKKE